MKEIEGVPEQPEVPVLEKGKPKKYWLSPAPETCDICGTPLTSVFVDGRTTLGPWGCMCVKCHKRGGYGLGTGSGQKYEKQSDNKWVKVGG